jgi:hypothetical protein
MISIRLSVLPIVLALATLPAALEAQVRKVTVARTLLGDAAVVINARTDGRIEVGVAGPERVIELAWPWGPVATWADSASKVLRSRRRPARNASFDWRAELDRAEKGGGITLTRTVTRQASTYSLFVADTSFGGFAVPVSADEAEIFVTHLRNAVKTTRRLVSESAADSMRQGDTTVTPKKKPAPASR